MKSSACGNEGLEPGYVSLMLVEAEKRTIVRLAVASSAPGLVTALGGTSLVEQVPRKRLVRLRAQAGRSRQESPHCPVSNRQRSAGAAQGPLRTATRTSAASARPAPRRSVPLPGG